MTSRVFFYTIHILFYTKYDEPTIFCFNEYGDVYKFDIETKQWTRSLILDLHLDYSYESYKPFSIPSRKYRMHVITRAGDHRKYDVENKYLASDKQTIYDIFEAWKAEPIFSQKTGQLLLFGERYHDKIMFNKPTSESPADYAWIKHHLTKPNLKEWP